MTDLPVNPLNAGAADLPAKVLARLDDLTAKHGVEFTGRDPGSSTVTRDGIVYPLATSGTAAGHLSLDPEAIAFRPDGTFYISDEYAAGIYYFDATGKQIGAQRFVIVDLAVEADDERAVVAEHRLVRAFGQIDDRQSAVTEPDGALPRQPFARAIRGFTPAARIAITGVIPLRMWKLQLGCVVTDTPPSPIIAMSACVTQIA